MGEAAMPLETNSLYIRINLLAISNYPYLTPVHNLSAKADALTHKELSNVESSFTSPHKVASAPKILDTAIPGGRGSKE